MQIFIWYSFISFDLFNFFLGLYTTITLAVYGKLTANIQEQIIQPVVNPTLPAQANTIPDVQQISAIENEWQQEPIQSVPIEYPQQSATPYPPATYVVGQEQYNQEYNEYYNEVPKDPRSYQHHTPETDWENKSRGRSLESDTRPRDNSYQKNENNNERDLRDNPDRDRRDRERDKRYSRSHSRDRERNPRDYREPSRERDWEHERHDYRERNDKEWDRDNRDNRYSKHQEYKRTYTRDESREDNRKRPRTPPIQSPKRPHTPHTERKDTSPNEVDNLSEEDNTTTERHNTNKRDKETIEVAKSMTPPKENSNKEEEPSSSSLIVMDVEEFEPILSDEDILDDNDHYNHQDDITDFDYTSYTNNDDILKLFTPGNNDVQRFVRRGLYKLIQNKIELNEELKLVISITDDFFKSSITKFTISTFTNLSKEFKEEFINLAERIINTIGDSTNFTVIVDIYKRTLQSNVKFDEETLEIINQTKYITETLLDWIEIALSYEMANVQDQPGYKIRHLKCGIRLIEWISSSFDFINLLWNNDFDIQLKLINLYKQEYMALSIKLMILRALDAYLQHKLTIERFLLFNIKIKKRDEEEKNGFDDILRISDYNGYKLLIELLRLNPSVRLKFALQSILKKLNLFEIVYKIKRCIVEVSSIKNERGVNDFDLNGINFIANALTQVLQNIQNGEFTFSQPKRFLPIQSQFEINRSDITKPVIVKYLAMNNLLQSILILLTHPTTLNLTTIRTPIYEILEELSKTVSGLRYMYDNVETMNLLIKCVLRMDYEFQTTLEINSQYLAQNIAYKLQCLYHLDYLMDLSQKTNNDCDCIDVIDQLHAIYCLTFTNLGKFACAEILSLNDNAKIILQYVNIPKEKCDVQIGKLKKSPATGYVIDLIYNIFIYTNCVEFVELNAKRLLGIINYQAAFETSTASKLNEIEQYLKSFDTTYKPLNYDNITPYVDIINKHLDVICNYPPQLTSALRIIKYLGISTACPNNNTSLIILNENQLNNYAELKYKHVILQLYSLEGVNLLSKILQKICDYYEQPAMFTSTFVSINGIQILNVIEPCVELIKQMLTYVIQCRNTNFKDLTTVPIILQTFNLLKQYPTTSVGYYKAQIICNYLLETLLVYTQPISEEIHEKDSLNKTLWTLMCGEVIKFTSSTPYTFMSGLLILSELLPLPLPIQTQDELKPEEITRAINLRKLWSAHLHPHNSNIQELVNRLCTTTHQPLLNLLRRVCVQFADLAANSAIIVGRGILDTIHNCLAVKDDNNEEHLTTSTSSSPTFCNGHVARLLNFLACLVTHGNLKCAIMQLLQNNNNVNYVKGDEKYPKLVPLFVRILKMNCEQNSHVQSQECILSVMQSLCDTEITLMQNAEEQLTSDVYLSNALPMKDTLLLFINGMIEHIMSDNSFLTYLPIARTFLLLTEHDYGFYHLKEHLMHKTVPLLNVLNKLDTNFSKDNAECLSTLNTLIEFLRVSSTIDEIEEGLLYKSRTYKMSIDEIKGLVGWDIVKETDNEKKHPLLNLETTLKVRT